MSASLFPPPTPSDVQPRSNTTKLRSLLQRNHDNWHVFINDIHFHNHMAFHLLALWAIGVEDDTLQSAYDRYAKCVKPIKSSPEPITKDNFSFHLGDSLYYPSYLHYFSELGSAGLVEALCSREYNFVDGLRDSQQPRMLSRVMDGLLHPLIHVGHGVMYHVPALTIEGMALTAISKASSGKYVRRALFTVPKYRSDAQAHPLTVMHRLRKDSRLVIRAPEREGVMYKDCMNRNSDIINSYVDDWAVGVDWNCGKAVAQKAEELVWANTVAYAGSYEESTDHFDANFFLMHLVTSSIYFRELLLQLTSPMSRVALTKTYFAASLTWWLATGGRFTNLQAFNRSTTLSSDNSWDAIFKLAVAHSDEHVPKFMRIVRLFSEFSSAPCKKAEIEGAHLLDENFFRRLAIKTMDVCQRTPHPWARSYLLKQDE